MDNTVKKLATQIAVWYSCLLNRNDDVSMGKRLALVSVADEMGFRIFVQGSAVTLKSSDGSFQVCS